MAPPPPAFKVVIVGGSVSGLTLAHCLERLGVEYTLLERRPAIVVQEGASIAVMPNGGRILDQLGLYDDIFKRVVPLDITDAYLPEQNGFQFPSDYPRKLYKELGYPIAFMERRGLLEILHKALSDKSKIHVNTNVARIEQGEGGAKVLTTDGREYEADLVVGADGIHSTVRREMWRLMGQMVVNNMAESEKQNMTTDFSCVFGFSHNVSEFELGEQMFQLANGYTFFIIGSKGAAPGVDNVVFWFLIWKLDRTYAYHEAPRYTQADAVAFCEARLQTEVKPGVLFFRLWEKRQAINMLPLQEGLLETWAHGRVVCIGDSAHKMTINTGQGANMAIEDVALLTNMLHGLMGDRRDKKPSYAEVEALLQRFYKQRLPRLRTFEALARSTVRVHAQTMLRQRLMARYVMPYVSRLVTSRVFRMLVNGPILDYLPPKRTEHPGWEKYKEKPGGNAGAHRAFPLLGLAALAAALAWYGWVPRGLLAWVSRDLPGWQRLAFY